MTIHKPKKRSLEVHEAMKASKAAKREIKVEMLAEYSECRDKKCECHKLIKKGQSLRLTNPVDPHRIIFGSQGGKYVRENVIGLCQFHAHVKAHGRNRNITAKEYILDVLDQWPELAERYQRARKIIEKRRR